MQRQSRIDLFGRLCKIPASVDTIQSSRTGSMTCSGFSAGHVGRIRGHLPTGFSTFFVRDVRSCEDAWLGLTMKFQKVVTNGSRENVLDEGCYRGAFAVTGKQFYS